ncbi:hypothetical protein [uncultured Sphingomonas sp.]|uniref:hypothetical protein n=1 Tax=uncultured Sphingomonas sp. TaxID=158754 RepID=UPI0037479FFA
MAHLADDRVEPCYDYRPDVERGVTRGIEHGPRRPHRRAGERDDGDGRIEPGERRRVDVPGQCDARGQGVITSSVVV